MTKTPNMVTDSIVMLWVAGTFWNSGGYQYRWLWIPVWIPVYLVTAVWGIPYKRGAP
jgi:hypothetical protein